MGFDGNGTFNRLYNWVADAAAGINILADRMDAEMDGFATGLSTCLTRDGQGSMEARLDMGGFNIANMADPTQPQHAVTRAFIDGKFATDAEAIAGTATDKIMSPAGVQARSLDTTNKNMTGVSFFEANMLAGATKFDLFLENAGVALNSNFSCNFLGVTNTVSWTRQNLLNATAVSITGFASDPAMIIWPGNLAAVSLTGIIKLRRMSVGATQWWAETILRAGNDRMVTANAWFILSGEPTGVRLASTNLLTSGSIRAVTRR
jgi:hypothetical protein